MNRKVECFSSDVCEKLGYYVYRLVDPRDGHTFYVGKGQNNRVFDHARGVLKAGEDAETAKIATIREIMAAGLDVIHIIHRFGLKDEDVAFEVESAVIDCFPGLTNIQSGHDSERGVINAVTLQRDLAAPCYEEPNDFEYLILKTTQKRINEVGIYEATRKAWRLDIKRAKKCRYVFSVVNGIVRKVYQVVPDSWKESEEGSGRYEFVGIDAPEAIRGRFEEKRVPEVYAGGKGKSNPVQYKR